MSKGKCPYWLDEGLAIYFSQELSDEYINNLFKAIKKDSIIPLEVLQDPLPAKIPEDFRQLAYAEVSSIADYLIETYGWNKIKSIIYHCARRPLKAILGDLSLNYYLMERGWKRWLQNKYA
jgi:hypothetical protein